MSLVFIDEQMALDESGKKKLEKFMPQIAGKRHRIEVRGYLSRRPLPEGSPYKSNWDVCFARCLAVMDVLGQNGVTSDLIRLNLAGPAEPDTNRNDAEWQGLNSRVEITVLDEIVKSTSEGTGE
jgi:flagellar motor protein MotB